MLLRFLRWRKNRYNPLSLKDIEELTEKICNDKKNKNKKNKEKKAKN